jgi:hypothetical protein
MDQKTLGMLIILALPIGAVAVFAWGHRHGVRTITEAINAVNYRTPPQQPPSVGERR